MFNFRLINTPDGNQVIDMSLKTPYEALTPIEMMEYMEVDRHMVIMERMERKQKKHHKQKNNLLWKIACACGIM